MRTILIILITLFTGGCVSSQKLAKRTAVAKTMKVQFDVPVEDKTVKTYAVYRSTTTKYWTKVTTINANKQPGSTYVFDIPYNYGYYRVRTNLTKGYLLSKNNYVSK